jgi:GH25 family lysozyme M1 (1,4-beta-N-acetylmuramidase)
MGDGLKLLAPSATTQAVQRVCGSGPTVFGIDVSYYQGDIDWNAVADDGVQFAIIRASDGTGFRDPKFAANWAGAKAAGIVRGVYQFFRSDDDPVDQANLMLEMMGELEPGDLPPTMDMESTDGVDNATRIARMHQWFDVVDAAVGAPALIYTGGYFWDDNVGTDEFNDHPLWHAGYTGGSCPTSVSNAWSTWTFWQYSSAPSNGDGWRTVDGIAGGASATNGSLDQNRFNGTFDELLAMTVGEAVCGDGRCSPDEHHDSCASDCPICEPLPPDGGIVSEDGLCFTGGGAQQYLRRVTDAGEGGGLIWTHTTDDADEANYGEWDLAFVEGGRYRLEAFTAAAYAQSRRAAYLVRHNGVDERFVLDQTAVDGWNVIAEDIVFAAGGDQLVHCGDNTGESLSGNVRLVYDAIRLTRLDATPVPAEGEGEGEGEAAGDGEGEAGDGDDRLRRIVVQNVPGTVDGGCSQSRTTTMAVLAPLVVALLGPRRWRRRSR